MTGQNFYNLVGGLDKITGDDGKEKELVKKFDVFE